MPVITVGNHTYNLPEQEELDSADRDYIESVDKILNASKRGLLTDRETLESLIVAHCTWASI